MYSQFHNGICQFNVNIFIIRFYIEVTISNRFSIYKLYHFIAVVALKPIVDQYGEEMSR
jgi:hypothetical protein